MDRYFRILNANQTIRQAIPKLIEAYTMFYGESEREFITEKLRNMFIAGYQNENEIDSTLINLREAKTVELIKRVFSKYNIEYNDENREKYVGNSSFRYEYSNKAVIMGEYFRRFHLGKEGRLKEEQERRYKLFKEYIPELEFDKFLSGDLTKSQVSKLPRYILLSVMDYLHKYDVEEKFLEERNVVVPLVHEINPLVTEDNIEYMINSGQLEKEERVIGSLYDASKEFKVFEEEKVEPYDKLKSKLYDYKTKVANKNLGEFFLEFKELASEEDRELILKQIEEGEIKTYRSAAWDVIYGNGLTDVGYIDFFSEQCEKELKVLGTMEYRYEVIKRNRIKYFNYRGINLGDNYDDYVNSPECQAIWPKQETIDKLRERRDYYLDKTNIEFYSSIDLYKQLQSEIDELHLEDIDATIQPSFFSLGATKITTNMRLVDGKYQLYPVLAFNVSGEPHDDVRLIHELNHVIELMLLGVDKDRYHVICGWDYLNPTINRGEKQYEDTIHKKEVDRKYEFFNETINELIAQKISKMMHENGIYIFNSEDYVDDTGSTCYEFGMPLVVEFFNTYLDTIVESRRRNNIQVILDKVGKDNFEMMNDLMNDFYNRFTEMEFQAVCMDMAANKNTDRVKDFKGFCNRKDQILAKMREYSIGSKVAL